VSQHYIIYGGELSYFTRKLEAAMIFYGADFEMRSKTPDMAQEIQLRSGTHQVPVLQTPENWMIGDPRCGPYRGRRPRADRGAGAA